MEKGRGGGEENKQTEGAFGGAERQGAKDGMNTALRFTRISTSLAAFSSRRFSWSLICPFIVKDSSTSNSQWHVGGVREFISTQEESPKTATRPTVGAEPLVAPLVGTSVDLGLRPPCFPCRLRPRISPASARNNTVWRRGKFPDYCTGATPNIHPKSSKHSESTL
jgi:hypothetical protein